MNGKISMHSHQVLNISATDFILVNHVVHSHKMHLNVNSET